MILIGQDDLIRQIEPAVRKLCASTDITRIGGCSVFVTLGMDVQWHGVTKTLAQIVEAGVLQQTGDVPIEIHYNIVPGSSIRLRIALSDVDAQVRALLKMLNPSDSIVDWAVQAAPSWDQGRSANQVLGLGIGGNPELAMQMARVALFEPHDIARVIARGANDWCEQLRVEMMSACASAGYPVKDVLIVTAPTHAGTKPVALMCGEPFANRVAHIVLNGDLMQRGAAVTALSSC
ncbi:tartrate dehydratase alpha subunit/fumarate hydratase class I-like protein [Paraburkholderia terricola]|jgi:tartrate dehydratase alpha subunit/fumarate hydratase class I-like protein|uniref:fumarate hydratase n=1 Tax=Paraburkholderia terricola TaxID=169427 RepID=UPI0028548DDA|nr:fumarate hydratase [Paraburkholderia terricola]MDR6450534.1 tartrate dehydratase alpha subunit/fumarate hydratase class I-like protein [Paraburkholderia terricola]MDR6495717.1 tartrate dehydratase alpha subunit/fumarate hydratase class I-like protein [Paraburkholderia terricola]